MEFRDLLNIMEEDGNKEYSRGDAVEYYKDGHKCCCVFLSKSGDTVKVVNDDDEVVEISADDLFGPQEELNEYRDEPLGIMSYLEDEYGLSTDESMYINDLLDTGEMTDEALDVLRKMYPDANLSNASVIDDIVMQLGHEFNAYNPLASKY